jgi:hypothetical protein
LAALWFRISAVYIRIEQDAGQAVQPSAGDCAAAGWRAQRLSACRFYYSHSHAYALILGLIQLGGGALLLFRKTALLGAALMLPVMTNIVMINVFFHIAWGAMGTSAFIFASMLAVLWHSRHALVGVFWTDQAGEPASARRYHRTLAALVVLLVISLMGFGLWLSAHR